MRLLIFFTDNLNSGCKRLDKMLKRLFVNVSSRN